MAVRIAGRVIMIKNLFFIIAPLLLLTAVNVIAADQKVIMDIKGMTCALWPIAIKKSLAGINGVKDTKVSYKEKKAWLTVEESVTDAMLVEALQKAGPYKGKVIERNPLNWCLMKNP